jgi:hypothetical protein
MLQAIPTTLKVNSYTDIVPAVKAITDSLDNLPKNSLPVNTLGTIQSNAKNIPEVTLYNSLGEKLKPANKLIGRA